MWYEVWQQYGGRIAGTLSGLLLGTIYLFFGFWNMLVFGFVIFIGFFIGKKQDDKVDLKAVLMQILPDKFKRF